ncbi:MAG: hypothetical protein HY340_03955 [Candidatus Kerfeldbacteria bacterium]|nr:hypothetical protein [Candidatus Kerfeldbacteria bacterium]
MDVTDNPFLWSICNNHHFPNSQGVARLTTGNQLWYSDGRILSRPDGPIENTVIGFYGERWARWLRGSQTASECVSAGVWIDAAMFLSLEERRISTLPEQAIDLGNGAIGRIEGQQVFWPDGSLAGSYEGEKNGGLAAMMLLMQMELEERRKHEEERLEREREAARQRAERRARIDQARAEGKYVCHHCDTIDPDRCARCSRCLSCYSSCGSLCSSCDADDDDD